VQRVLMYFKNEIKVKNIAILHDSNAYGTGGADQVKAQAPKYSVNIVADESYGSADTDMTAQLTKIAQTKAQVILVWGTNPGPASIAKNMQQLNITLPFVASSGIANKKFIELAGTAANGVVFTASRLILPSTIPAGSKWADAVESFSTAYKQEYGTDIDTFAAHGWDASNMVVNAIKEVGEDSGKIRDQIQSLKDYAGADGVFTYSATDHAGLKVDALIMVKIENGQWVEAKP
jgi:branched-chain amino acid transport system substrate-binding protein